MRKYQRKLNPEMKEVVRKDITHLLDACIIYPVLKSKWVSPVHCVPKKGRFTLVPNKHNELILTRTIVEHRVCIGFMRSIRRHVRIIMPYRLLIRYWRVCVTPSMRLYLPRVGARLRGITALKAMSQVR